MAALQFKKSDKEIDEAVALAYSFKDNPSKILQHFIIAISGTVPFSSKHGEVLLFLGGFKYIQRKFDECLKLSQLARKTSISQTLLVMAHAFEIKCMLRMGKKEEAVAKYEKIKDTYRIEKANMDLFINDCDKHFKTCSPDNNYLKQIFDEIEVPTLDENPELPYINRNVKVREIKPGIAVFAKADIKKGDTILVEEPYCAFRLDFCSNCMKKLDTYVPCSKCSSVLYCTKQCSSEHMDFHHWECIFNQGVPLSKGLRMILFGLRMYFMTHVLKKPLLLPEKKTEMSPPYMQFLTPYMAQVLVTFKKRGIYEWLIKKYSLDLTSLVKDVEFSYIISWYSFIGIYESKSGGDNIMFYTAYSDFRHSCQPNTAYYFSGNKLILKAIRDIKNDEEIFTSYGSLKHIDSAKERNDLLKDFFNSECNCELCKNHSSNTNLKNIMLCKKCSSYSDYENGYLKCKNCKDEVVITRLILESIKTIASKNLEFAESTEVSAKETVGMLHLVASTGFNPGHSLVTPTLINFFKSQIKKGNLDVFDTFKLRPVNEVSEQMYERLFEELEKYIKSFYSLNKTFSIKVSIAAIRVIKEFLTDFHSYFSLYNPRVAMLKRIEKLMWFFQINIMMTCFEENYDWNDVEPSADSLIEN